MRRTLVLVAALVAAALVTGLPPVGGAGDRIIGGDAAAGETVEYRDGSWIVELKPGTDTQAFLAAHGIDSARALVYRNIFTGFSATLSAEEVSAIAGSPDTVYVEADQIVTGQTDQTTGPVSTHIPNSGVLPWGLDLIDQRSATVNGKYTYTTDGTGVKVYVVDSGVNAAHSDFGSRVVDGWSYRAQSFFMDDPDGAGPLKSWARTNLPSCKSYLDEQGNRLYPDAAHPVDMDTYDYVKDAADKGKTDNEGHGTHVAGIVGGSLTGVAKNVTIVPVRILNSCGLGTTTMANYGLDWILGDHTNSQRAVVNMSIGFEGRPCTFERLISGQYDPASVTSGCRTAPSSWLLGEGITVVAAAGNDPSVDPCNTSPAATPGTISVGAVGSTMREAVYSAYGQCVDIFAPGGSGYTGQGVNSTWHYLSADPSNTSPYENEAGTSMAAPHVAGAVALYLGGLASLPADITTLPGQVWTWLKNQATCDIVTYQGFSGTQSPNRFLNIGSAPAAPCAPKNVTGTQAAGSSTVSWSEVPSGNGNEITGYSVTTSPSTAGCTTLVTDPSPFTCTLIGLTDGVTYAVSVRATTSGATQGTASSFSLVAGVNGTTVTTAPPETTVPATTTTVLQAVTPTASNPVRAVSTATSTVITWPAVLSSETVIYQVSVSPGGVSCTSTSTRCTFLGTSVGTSYTFSITARTASGQTSAVLRYVATAGINQKVFSVKKSSKTLLTKVVTSLSKGKRTYKVTSGKCKVLAGKLVAPTAVGTCKVKVSIARAGKYRAMSAVLTVPVV